MHLAQCNPTLHVALCHSGHLSTSLHVCQVCADTIVGSHIRRGISGGQKKRVTTGEIVVGPCKVLLMDEISVRWVR